jgi:DNA-binding LacI/PurR family transcriptional regulator
MVGQEIDGLDIPSVVQDNYQGGRKAVEFLIENGHKRIGIISGPSDNFSAQQRLSAYMDVLKENNLPVYQEYISQGTFTLPSGYDAMKEILERSRQIPTAVFASNDMMAMGAVKAILEKGYCVPDDISIVGFDNVVLSEYFIPALTTIHQNHYEVGKQAGELLMEYLRNKEVPVKRLILEQRLIVRDSVRKI